MAMGTLTSWRRLLTEEAQDLLSQIDSQSDLGVPAVVERLRRDYPDWSVAEAIELITARRRAARKFPDHKALLCDLQGVEQATSQLVAEWKAQRFQNHGVLDLCSGIGGDAMALSQRGEVIGVDESEIRCLMCGHNAGIDMRVEDVCETSIDLPYVHIDPARRIESIRRRSWRLEDLRPSLDSIIAIIGQTEGAAVKLGPGIPRDLELPGQAITTEFIAEGGTLVQSVVWCGALAHNAFSRRATDVSSGRTLEGNPGPSPVREGFGSVLMVPHPALERAGLIHEAVGDAMAGELAPGLGILGSDESVTNGWFDNFEIEEVLPPRESRIKAWLRARNAGRVVVRTRDQAVDADRWTRMFQGKGDEEIILFGLRLGRKVVVIAARRGAQGSKSNP